MDAAKNCLVLRACQWSDLEQPTPHLTSCDPRGLPASWDLPEHRVLWTFPCSHSNVSVGGCRECAKQWEYPAEETQQFSRHPQCRMKELRLTHSKAACKSKPSYSRIERSHHITPAMALEERRGNVAYEDISILIYQIAKKNNAKLQSYLVALCRQRATKINPDNKDLWFQRTILSWSSIIYLVHDFTHVFKNCPHAEKSFL